MVFGSLKWRIRSIRVVVLGSLNGVKVYPGVVFTVQVTKMANMGNPDCGAPGIKMANEGDLGLGVNEGRWIRTSQIR